MRPINKTDLLTPGERLDDLQRNGYAIIQRPGTFCFGTDAVLLAHFASKTRKGNVVDLCSGNGAVALLMAARLERPRFELVEIQPDMADMASRSILYNGQQERMRVHCMDGRQAPEHLGAGVFDAVTLNPPYAYNGSGRTSPNPALRAARHEGGATLHDLVLSAGKLLKNGGSLYTIMRSDRMTELFCGMRACGIEPKRLQLVQPRSDKPPNLLLLQGIKLARPGMHFLPTLNVYAPEGGYTRQMLQIYTDNPPEENHG